MIPRRLGSAARLKCAVKTQPQTRLQRSLAVTTRTLREQTQGRVHPSLASCAFSQTRLLNARIQNPRVHGKDLPRHNARWTKDSTATLLESRFPTKTVLILLTLGGLAYYFIDIVESDWTDSVYAAFATGDDTSQLATPLHFYGSKEEVQHILDFHIPDPSAPMKDPAVAKFFSEQFDKLCFGWMMTPDDARKGVEGMAGVEMPITHGCRFRSNEPCEDFFALGTSPGPGEKPWNYWTVLDGHAGRHTAFYLQWTLIPMVSSALTSLPPSATSEKITSSIKTAFTTIDKTIMERAKTAANWYPAANAAAIAALTPAFSGSCALLAAFDPSTSKLRVACTGDSRAVLGRWDPSTQSYIAIPLSEDQTGFNTKEVERLAQEHPGEPSVIDPKTGRMLGIAVTRAFGDHRWKWDNDTVKTCQYKFWGAAPRQGNTSPPYMTAEPEVTEMDIVRAPLNPGKAKPGTENQAKSDFLILASDGLWDRISSSHAVDCISSYLASRTRGAGSVKNDPLLLSNPPVYPANFSALDPGVTVDPEKGEGVEWQATPQYFAIEDENAAVCLARNAMGGTRRGLFLGVLAGPEPWSRNAVDDTTVMVVFFDRLGEGDGEEGSTGDVGKGGKKEKKWWRPWPLG
jgi:pyruvate dehydrogenase phosphatase